MGLFDGTPHWTDSPGEYSLKSEQAGGHIGSLFLGGMQLAQQRDQQQQVMAQRIKEFGAQESTRQLQNKLLQSKLDTDAADAKALADWFPSFMAAKGDALHSMPMPLLRDPSRLAQIEQVVAGRINLESGSTSERLEASIRANAVKNVSALHPDLQGPAWDILKSNNGLPDSDFSDYIGFAASETERLGEAAKLRLFESQEDVRRATQLIDEEAKRETQLQNSDLIGKRQIDLERERVMGRLAVTELAGEYRIDAARSKEQGVTEDTYVNRHLNALLRQGFDAADADAILRRTFNGIATPSSNPVSHKISAADEVRLKDLDEDEKRIKTRQDKNDEALDGDPKNKTLLKRKMDFEQQLRDFQVKKTNLLQKYEAPEKFNEVGIGNLKAADEARSKALPLPSTKGALVKGSLYQTTKGLAIWDGEHFIAQ